MPMYTFESDDGERLNLSFPMSKAPRIGSTVRRKGKAFTRVVSGGIQISADVANVVHGYPYVSNSLPRNLDGCEHTDKGKPIIQSREHERSIAARYDYTRE